MASNLMAFYYVIDVEDWTCIMLVEYYRSQIKQGEWKNVLDSIKKDLIKVASPVSEFDIIRRKAQGILDRWKDWTASYNDFIKNLSCARTNIDNLQVKTINQLNNLTGDSSYSTQNIDNRRTTLKKRPRDEETERASTQLKKTLSSGSSMEGPDIRNFFSRTRSISDLKDRIYSQPQDLDEQLEVDLEKFQPITKNEKFNQIKTKADSQKPANKAPTYTNTVK
ncbi:1589_t:CDS:2, partial [Funneliformis caledonium]